MDTNIIGQFFNALLRLKASFPDQEQMTSFIQMAENELRIIDEDYISIFQPICIKDLAKKDRAILDGLRGHLYMSILLAQRILSIIEFLDDIELYFSLSDLKDGVKEFIYEIDYWVD